MAIFFPGLFFRLFSQICSFMVVWVFEVGVLDWVFGVVVFQLMVFGACGVGRSGLLGLAALYKHKRITLGREWCMSMMSIGFYADLFGL